MILNKIFGRLQVIKRARGDGDRAWASRAEDSHRLYRVNLAALVIILTTMSIQAQSLDARITIVSPAQARIEGTLARAATAWSFRNAYAGVLNLGERIKDLKLADSGGNEVPVRKLAPGEYEAARGATRFNYTVALDPPSWTTDAAHVSWLAGERALLLPGDLLPLPLKDAKVSLVLPLGWVVASVETKNVNGEFELQDAEDALFFAGRDLRVRGGRAGAIEYTFVAAGEWAFADEEVADAVDGILKEHERTMGGAPARRRAMAVLAPFPRPAVASQWSAETRGATVFLLSGRASSKIAGLAQLSVPLSHELFHLWVPNSLALDGAYDWFYEGFTMYQAMRAGMRLGSLNFQDYLNALGRAFDTYLATPGRAKFSLLDASQRRWTTSAALVYNKGMLVAFLYDLTLQRQTSGKHSLDDVYRELLRRCNLTEPRRDANGAVIEALSDFGGMRDFTRRYIETAAEIDLASMIAPFGLRAERAPTRVTVADSLSRAQRDLLRKFGYNEKAFASWQGPR